MVRRLFTRKRTAMATTLAALVVAHVLTAVAVGCPFCSAVTNTFSEDIAGMDVVFIGRLTNPGQEANASSAASDPPATSLASFRVDKILKGKDLLGASRTISTPFFGDAQQGDSFLVMGSDPSNLSWSAPLRVNERQQAYLLELMALPKEGPARLVFFQEYLQDEDPMLAQDAYDEFARSPYDVVKQLKDQMDHDQLVEWIEDPNVSASHRRLYLTMLGICGSEEDLPMLERRMRSSEAADKSGLDALIACYLTLRGPEGVALVEELFLKQRDDNFSGDYADVYAAIMALRFHGDQADVIPRARIIQALRHLLDNPQMADLVIPDLARWEDWTQLDRLIELFKNVDEKSNFVRLPIINYVRACPLPAADQALAQFKQIDPEAVQRAMTFFPTLTSPSKQ